MSAERKRKASRDGERKLIRSVKNRCVVGREVFVRVSAVQVLLLSGLVV